jgi:hypothetical protein
MAKSIFRQLSEAVAAIATKAGLAVSNAWSKTQAPSWLSLVYGATINWDASVGQIAGVVLAGNATLANPTGIVSGATYVLQIGQDSTGNRVLSFGSAYKFPGGTVPSLSTSANAIDYLTFVASGTNMNLIGKALDVK